MRGPGADRPAGSGASGHRYTAFMHGAAPRPAGGHYERLSAMDAMFLEIEDERSLPCKPS